MPGRFCVSVRVRLDVAEHVLRDILLLGRDHRDVVERLAGAGEAVLVAAVSLHVDHVALRQLANQLSEAGGIALLDEVSL